MLMYLVFRVVVNAIALWVAASLIDGMTLTSDWGSVLFVAFVFGLVNAFLKPIAKLLSFPFVVLTLGLFTLVVNAAMLSVTDYLTDSLNVDGFWNSVYGAAAVSVVSWLISAFLPDGS